MSSGFKQTSAPVNLQVSLLDLFVCMCGEICVLWFREILNGHKEVDGLTWQTDTDIIYLDTPSQVSHFKPDHTSVSVD